MRREVLAFALGGVVVVASLGAAMAVRNDGLEFPDGSVQKTAALLAASSAVQGQGNANIPDLEFCSTPQTLYTVPLGKRLAIEWISARVQAPILADPVEIYITTRNGVTPIVHPLVRIDGSQVIDGSFFWTQLWNSGVRLYSDSGQNVEISACRDSDVNDTHFITVTFSGHLVDVS